MKFRPCIDIHEGVVKQIVGSSLTEDASRNVVENFVASRPASDFATQYKADGLLGGHVIMLGSGLRGGGAELAGGLSRRVTNGRWHYVGECPAIPGCRCVSRGGYVVRVS